MGVIMATNVRRLYLIRRNIKDLTEKQDIKLSDAIRRVYRNKGK